MAQQIQIRGDNATAWTAANPTLADREIAIETDTRKFKVGDGTTPWNTLEYIESIRKFERINISISAGILTLDMENEHERKFEVATPITSAFSIAFANVGEVEFMNLTLYITGTVVVTVPSNVVMQKSDSRWSNGAKTLTLVGVTAEPFELSFNKATTLYLLKTSDAYNAT